MRKTLPVFIIALYTLFTNSLSAQEGTFDTSFGKGGKTSSFVGISPLIYGSVIQPDGKIILVGNSYGYQKGSSFLLVRYLSDGSLDASFGNKGVVTTLIGNNCTAQSIALQNDGKIIVAGSTYAPAGDKFLSDIMVARYDQNGSLDSSFGNNGIKVVNLEDSQNINSLLIQKDGKIIVGGTFMSLNNDGYTTFGLARFNIDGSIDTSYGTDGFVHTPGIRGGEIFDMKFIDNEDVIAVGRRHIISNSLMARYNSNGQLVKSFGLDGSGIIEEYLGKISQFNKCVILKNNDIYIGASVFNGTKYNGLILKYSASGKADASFGKDGKILRDFGTNTASFVNDIMVDYNNNLMVGYSVGPTTDYDFGIESYSLNGTLNTTFGNKGLFVFSFFSSGHDYFRTMSLQTDNKIIMAGNHGGVGIARVNNSKVLSTINFDKKESHVIVSPNPVGDFPVLTIQIENPGKINAVLYDSKGTLVSNLISNKTYNTGDVISDILDLYGKNMAKGIYFLKVENDGKLIKTIKIVK